MKNYIILPACIAVLAAGSLSAQMSITALNTEVIVDFDSSLSGVNNGTFAAGGIVGNPSAGQLDSSAWRVTGLAAGDTTSLPSVVRRLRGRIGWSGRVRYRQYFGHGCPGTSGGCLAVWSGGLDPDLVPSQVRAAVPSGF